MTLIAEPERFPRMPGQQSDIAPGSPIAVVALFSEITRERFRPGNELAWLWTDNPTPAAAETNTPGAPRKILIEPAFSVNDEVRNFRPAIFIDKGDTAAGKVAINNFAGQQIKSGLRGFYTIGTVPISIEVVSDSKGESALIADIVWFYFLAGVEQIRSTFGIHALSPPNLGRTQPYESDKAAWSTSVTFEAQIEFRWLTQPISPLLNSIVVKYKASGETNPDTFLLKSYIR